jgi:cytochrome c-type biogenesis protein CcmH
MRRGIAVAFALLALGAAALAWAIVGASEAGAPERGWTVAQMERELMCPVCDSRLDMSTQPAANRIRVFLAAKRRQGWTRSQVREVLRADYGERVFAEPPHRGFGLLAWLVPALALAGGCALAAVLARRWAHTRREPVGGEAAAEPLDEAERDRLERQLDADLQALE